VYDLQVEDDECQVMPTTAATQLLGALRETAQDASHATSVALAVAVPFDFSDLQRTALRYYMTDLLPDSSSAPCPSPRLHTD
jgi:molecular chaperone DnaK (HSP70)